MFNNIGLDTTTVQTAAFSIQIIILMTFLIVFMFYVLSSLISILLSLAVVLYPFAVSLYPFKSFKKLFLNFNIVLLTMLAVVPLQSLCISIASRLFFNSIFSLTSVASLFGLLIIITFIIPGLAITGFNKLFALAK